MLPRLLAALLGATLLAVLVPVAPASASTFTGRLLVTFDQAPSPEAAARSGPTARASRARTHGTAVRRLVARTSARRALALPELGAEVVKPPAGVGARAFAATLRDAPGVAHVELERRHELRVVPNDPALVTPEPSATAPGVALQWWAARTGLFGAWDVTRGEGARVAVIDTGIDASHPDLTGRIAGAFNRDGTSGSANTDENGHGTHVASMACAAGDNGAGIVGAGFACRLLVYKTDLSDGSIAQSIRDAADQGAHAINMSFGTDGSQPAARIITSAIDYAVGKDAVLVAAAADAPVQEQGDPSNVLQPTGTGADITQGKGLSVTAANFADRRASFAGLGSQISLAAYGAYNVSGGPRGIIGAFPGGATELERGGLFQPGCGCRTSIAGDGRYAYLQGTSMAAPMVAAVAALVRDLNPDLAGLEVVRILKQSARRPSGGWTADLGWGILDANAAVGLARVIDRRAPRSTMRRAATPRTRTVTLRWTRSDKGPARLIPSGIDKIEIWRSANGGKYRRLATTRKSSFRMRVKPGSYYDFYTRAVDKAGNREAIPKKRDMRVRAPKRLPR
jgi:serine protease